MVWQLFGKLEEDNSFVNEWNSSFAPSWNVQKQVDYSYSPIIQVQSRGNISTVKKLAAVQKPTNESGGIDAGVSPSFERKSGGVSSGYVVAGLVGVAVIVAAYFLLKKE